MRYLPLLLLLAFPAWAADDICMAKQDTVTICPDPLLNDGDGAFYVFGTDMETGKRIESLVSSTKEGGTIEIVDGVWVYTPLAGFVGRDETTYRAEYQDERGQMEFTIKIAVTCP